MGRRIIVLFVLAAFLAACQAAQSVQDFSNRQFARYAIGKSYAEVAATPDFKADSFGRVKMYGRAIGSYQLATGDVVHRHIKRYGAQTSTTDFGLFGSSEKVRYEYRLAYFRVGPDGIVKDMAIGIVPGEINKCAEYFYGIVQKCEEGQTPAQSLAIYDQVVRTSDGQPISAWGQPLAMPAVSG